jgi:hypothetical protein
MAVGRPIAGHYSDLNQEINSRISPIVATRHPDAAPISIRRVPYAERQAASQERAAAKARLYGNAEKQTLKARKSLPFKTG